MESPYDLESPEQGDSIYGFYRTAEGRKFLRDVYRRYLMRVRFRGKDSFSDTKVASMIADDDFLNQDGEIRLTRAALKRWSEDGQIELWRNDAQKSLRVMRRLEEQMMLEPEIAEICHDRAATIRRTDVANALCSFFYGSAYRSTTFSERSNLKRYEGVFAAMSVREVNTYNEGYLWGPYSVFWRLEAHADFPFLVFQEFSLKPKDDSDSTIFTRRRSGYAFLGSGDCLIRFVVSLTDPQSRWIENYRPMDDHYIDLIRDEGAEIVSDDLAYLVDYASISSSSANDNREERGIYSEGILLRRVDINIKKSVDERFNGIMWDIPL